MLAESLPAFDSPVPENGYHWWYLDGISDCGTMGVVVIVFIGSVFSPYYFSARKRGRGNPYNHCAVNVALYSPRRNHWAMTERGEHQVRPGPQRLEIADSSIEVEGQELAVNVYERCMPWGTRLAGTIKVSAEHSNARPFTLDDGERHHWQPVAPVARIHVNMQRPAIQWNGDAYVDSNFGQRALEDDFVDWHWCRYDTNAGPHIHYSVTDRQQQHRALVIRQDPAGQLQMHSDKAANTDLGKTLWGLTRTARTSGVARLRRSLEDAPFYARSMLDIECDGQQHAGVHENLSLDRFRTRWVRTLLPFRMPRITR